jgi:hypothetical protein
MLTSLLDKLILTAESAISEQAIPINIPRIIIHETTQKFVKYFLPKAVTLTIIAHTKITKVKSYKIFKII